MSCSLIRFKILRSNLISIVTDWIKKKEEEKEKSRNKKGKPMYFKSKME